MGSAGDNGEALLTVQIRIVLDPAVGLLSECADVGKEVRSGDGLLVRIGGIVRPDNRNLTDGYALLQIGILGGCIGGGLLEAVKTQFFDGLAAGLAAFPHSEVNKAMYTGRITKFDRYPGQIVCAYDFGRDRRLSRSV